MADEESVPIPDWHRKIIEERLKSHRANPSESRPWDEVRNEILEKLRKRRTR